jgi:hypothetical protein
MSAAHRPPEGLGGGVQALPWVATLSPPMPDIRLRGKLSVAWIDGAVDTQDVHFHVLGSAAWKCSHAQGQLVRLSRCHVG